MSMTHEPDQGPDLPRSLPGQWPRRRFLGAAGLVGASALVGPFGNPVRASAQELIPDATDPHADGLSATGLTVEHLIDPLGIDRPDPLLGWNLTASRAGAAQSAYQIKVSKRPDGGDVVWSSGRVHSAQSFDIAYAGTRLTSRTRYYWQVRVWDERGATRGWSEVASFETALLSASEFGGQWIGSPNRPPVVSLSGSNWIWYRAGNPADSAPAGTRYFRKEVVIPSGSDVTVAQIQMTADDKFVLYVNGTPALQSPDAQDTWSTMRVTDITSFLHQGSNTLAVEATNTLRGPAGLLGRLHVETAAGDVLDVITDDSWQSADTEQTGWESPTFDASNWPAALVAASYGSAPWFSSVNAPAPPEALLRQRFDLGKRVSSARVYISGLGYYKLYLNGARIGDHELDPGFTVYDKTTLYATYDVTKALRSGENVVGVSLGRGYFGQMVPDEWVSSPWHDEPKLRFELHLTYTDGSTRQVTSGTHWRSADGPTTAQSVWLGEDYDARLEQPGWNAPGFDDTSWRPAVAAKDPGGQLRSQLFPAIKITQELADKGVAQPAPGITVHDFGTPTAGWANVAVQGPRGATVKIKYGEKLRDDGTVNDDDVFFTVQNYSYTLKGGGPEHFQPSYSYAGYRYVQVSVPDGVTLIGLTGMRVHTAVETTGGFSSSSALLNAYQSAQASTILNNLHSVPTDTPMYEKRPYTADAFLSADSAIANFGMQNFYQNWMRTHRDDQSPDGTFGNTVPGTVGGKATTDPVWSSSYVLITWDLYWYYGDLRALAENYDGLKKWMDHYQQNIAGTGGIYTGFSYGDWLSPAGAQAPEGTRLTATAYLYKGATVMAKIATALGHAGDAERYSELAASIADTFNATFYNAAEGAYFDNPAAGYRQTSNVLPLRFGLVPQQYRATVFANLVKDITDRGNHLNTGCLGTKELLPLLTENGQTELAYAVATNPTYPGWGYWFTELDATTMWEEWGAQSRSHDHAFLGTVVDWLYQDVAGIQPAAPGYRSIRIQPHPTDALTQAEGHVDSPFGEIRSSWTKDDNLFTLTATVPVGAKADIFVPVSNGQRVSIAADQPAGLSNVSAGSAALPASEGVRDGFERFSVGSGVYRFTAKV